MKNPLWKVLSIGCLSNNGYWDETSSQRSQICTSTIVEVGSRRVIVDPCYHSIDGFRRILDERTGLSPDQIDTIFLTHFHATHRQSVSLFPKAVWLMSKVEIHWWNRQRLAEEELDCLARIVPIEDYPIEGVEIVPTPGHTHGHTSLRFETREGMVMIAGDAVLTFDHFDNREPSRHAEDPREARRSIDTIAKTSDLIVPGHDNFFVV